VGVLEEQKQFADADETSTEVSFLNVFDQGLSAARVCK
jgi:hypothetical protein